MAITYTKELIGVSYHPDYQATDGSVTNAIYEIVVNYTGTETVGENTYTANFAVYCPFNLKFKAVADYTVFSDVSSLSTSEKDVILGWFEGALGSTAMNDHKHSIYSTIEEQKTPTVKYQAIT
jgi:hypothetical protein|tara:strand:- start:5316 stop:5684 length:369 start_codon:yes stop_codon:yes gene_type:complete